MKRIISSVTRCIPCLVAAGMSLTCSAIAGTFTNSFDTDPAGLVFINGPAKWVGTGGVNNSGYISLTDALNDQNGGTLVLPDLDSGAAIGGFVATFKLRFGGGSARPADGFSFNFGPGVTDSTTVGEEGVGNGVTICFDSWDNNGTDTAPAIDVKIGGNGDANIIATAFVVGQREGNRARPGPIFKDPVTGADFDMRTGANFENVRIEWRDGLLTLNLKGVDVFKNLPVLLAPTQGQFCMGARTGGANDNHWIDELSVRTFPPSATPTVSGFNGNAGGVSIQITDSTSQVNQSSIGLMFDNATVTPQKNKVGSVTTVTYTTPALLTAGTSHAVTLTFADTSTPPVSKTIDLSYVVGPYTVIPREYAFPTNSANTSTPGFRVRSVQARSDAGLVNTVARALAQLAGTLIDPNTAQPFVNEANLVGAVGGYVNETNVINYDEGMDHGNFTSANGFPDMPVPGIPGTGGHADNYSVEMLTYLDLPAGVFTFGVNSDDGFALYTCCHGPEGPHQRSGQPQWDQSMAGGHCPDSAVRQFSQPGTRR
jgi:lectin family protein